MWMLEKIYSPKEQQSIGTGSVQVTISERGQEVCRCGTGEHRLVGVVVMGWQLDFMIVEVFSNLNDSMILNMIFLNRSQKSHALDSIAVSLSGLCIKSEVVARGTMNGVKIAY